jgi:hypothetical protein
MEPVTPEPPSTTGMRVAGLCLIFNALLLLLELAAVGLQSGGGRPPPIVPAIIDVLIGGSLLAGNEKLKTLAIVRCVLGGLVFTGVSLYQGDPIVAAFQVLVSAALLGLLIGRAGTPRVAVASMAFLLYLVVGVIGLAALKTGKNPFAALAMAGQTDPLPADRTVRGLRARYTIQAPSGAWAVLKPEVAAQQNALADRWLVRPDVDAHVLIIAEEYYDDGAVDLAAFERMVLDNARTEMGSVTRVSARDLAGGGRLVRARGTHAGMQLEFAYGLFIGTDRVYQVIGFASAASYPHVEGELLAAIDSFGYE